ncbi:MAG: hypothetical protein V3S05_07955, partial [Desulfobacterales bacterium]
WQSSIFSFYTLINKSGGLRNLFLSSCSCSIIDIAVPNCIPLVAKDVPESIQTNQHHMKHIEITKKKNFV